MRSQAPLSSSNPPRTLCSASAECGGTRSRATSSSPRRSGADEDEKIADIVGSYERRRRPPVNNAVDKLCATRGNAAQKREWAPKEPSPPSRREGSAAGREQPYA